MNKTFIGRASFYPAAIALAAYLANGESLAQHVTYAVTAVIATYMSQRRPQATEAAVTRLPDQGDAHRDDFVIVRSRVEELLSHAS